MADQRDLTQLVVETDLLQTHGRRVVPGDTMSDAIVLALTAAMTWGLWQALVMWGVVVDQWLWAWGMWVCRELGA